MLSDDMFENFFALYLVTGMRKREIIEYSNISKSEKPNYIIIDRVLKTKNQHPVERPCLFDVDIVIEKFY